jgi:pilus assembly protein CpaB
VSQRTILVLLLAVISGVSAVVGVRRLLKNPAAAPKVETVKVVVATQDLPPGELVAGGGLKSRDFPKDLAPAGAIGEVEAAAGRAAIVPISRDEPVLESKLAPRGVGGGLAALVPIGMRAVCIQIVSVAAGHAGLIVPKNRVDVLFTATDQGPNDPTGGGSTTTLLQDVEILAVDQKIYITGDHKVDSRELRSVTLLVSPDQAAKLDLAQNKGTLHLALRNPKDDRAVDPQPALLSDLRVRQEKPAETQAPVPEPAPAPATEPPLRIRTLRGRAGGVISIHGS